MADRGTVVWGLDPFKMDAKKLSSMAGRVRRADAVS